MSMLSRFATLGGEPGDPYWANVVLLLTGNTLTDSSSPQKTVTATGNVSVSTSQYKFGTGSLDYTSTGSMYLTIPNSSYFNLSGAPYTLEFWIRPTGDYAHYNTILAKRFPGTDNTAWEIYLQPSAGVIGYYNGSLYSSSTSPTANVWSFVAAVYDGSNMNIYYNGNRIYAFAVGNTNNGADVIIGAVPAFSEQYNGYIDDLRITKGIARYSGTTCPVPTKAFPTY